MRKGNARYKVREGFLEGSKVTLHGNQMWNFMDRLVTMVLPRQTDFAGLSHGAFDGRGNYGIGIRDINLFLEVEAQHGNMLNFPLNSARGCGVYVHTTAETDAEAKLLLSALRFPFVPPRKPTPTLQQKPRLQRSSTSSNASTSSRLLPQLQLNRWAALTRLSNACRKTRLSKPLELTCSQLRSPATLQRCKLSQG